jgi:hypothetical protein
MTFYSVIPIAVLLIIIILRYVQVKEPTEKILTQKKQQELLDEESKGSDKYSGQQKSTKDIQNSGIPKLDIKGAILLAISITSFLSALSFVQS